MKCIIIDDDILSCRVLEDFISRTSYLEHVQTFNNAVEAINFHKQENAVDLIFLDIEMPEMSGIDFLNSVHNPPQIIIISSMEKYALEAFEYSVTDYLLKPISYARFFKAANKAFDVFDKVHIDRDDKEIFIKKSNSLVKIKYSEIIWVEALENYVVINTLNDKFTIHFTMKSIENQLPGVQFKRIHRSFIVNIREIFSIEDNTVIIKMPDGKKSIPIGKSYREKLMREINLMNK